MRERKKRDNSQPMLTRPVRLQAAVDKYSSKWHSVKGQYLSLFDPTHVGHVERWYNTIAPARHRDAFRAVMKGILRMDPAAASLQETDVETCRMESMLRLYGAPLSEKGKAHARCWLLRVATPSDVDGFRDVFTGIEALFSQESHFKTTFKYRPLPEIPSKNAHRQKIDWSNTNAHQQVARAESALASLGTTPRGSGTADARRQQQRSVLSDAATDEKIDALKQKRLAHQQTDKYSLDPKTGCSTFTATSTSPRRQVNSKHRVMATFQADDASGWISTTRDMIRNYGTRGMHVERVVREEHPAIAITTASVGLCVPAVANEKRH